VMEDAEFRAGDIEIQWLERRLADLTNRAPEQAAVVRAAIAAALLAERERSAPHRAAAPNNGNGTGEQAPSTDGWLRAARLEALR